MASATTVNPARSWTRLDGVDLLRGLAILLVLMNHVNMQLLFAKVKYLHEFPPQLATSIAWNGQQGVQIFFAVSGFLITSTTLRRWGTLDRISIRDFYVLRFARIAPLLLTLLAILSILHAAGAHGFVVKPSTGGLPRALLAALTFHVNWLEAHRGYLPAAWDILWSLSVEEMFYLGFPLLCRWLGRGKLLAAVLCIFVFLGPFARTELFNPNEVWREYSYLGGMDAIALGCLTALLATRANLSRTWLRLSLISGAALLIFSLCFSLTAYRIGLGRTGLYMTVVALGTCLLMAAARQSQWIAPRLLTPLLIMGRRSYEIYLTHIFIVIAVFTLFNSHGKPMRAVPLVFAVVIVAATILGSLVARFYSEPLNRWLRTRMGDGPSKLGSVVTGSE